ncbi:MAG: hypothetical protein QF721_11990 [Verrucomicrobiota bacterium]|nr:hypothetical protein [Verrucomicrobiota bacterium]
MFEGNPFPGLRPFEFDENYLFFGREEQVAQLLQRLGNTRFLAVVGASGSGKSSLVRAGLLPELHGGTMTSTSIAWELSIMRPGGDPLTKLAQALVESNLFGDVSEENILQTRATLSRSGLGLIEAYRQSDIEEGSNLLLLVDQFEEIFRFRQSGEKAGQEASHFIQLLLETARQTDIPIFIILTMRSDFLGDCAEFKGLAEAVNEGEYLIPRLNRKQRARAIEGPVKVGGAEISPRLKQQLLNDIGDDPDQLPILQHALMRMWAYWQTNSEKGKVLDLEDYDAIGRMAEALSRHADEVYEELPDDDHRLLCMKLFKAITEKQANGRGIRRPLPFGEIDEITGHQRDKMLTVIDAYRPTGRTFIMPGESVKIHDKIIIDISHESLMRVWQRLKNWVNDEADSARIYIRLCETAQLHNRGEAGFYRDPDLKIALAWRDNNKPNANWGSRINNSFELAMRFLGDSREDFEAEQKAKEQARKRELEQAKALAEAEKERAEIQRKSAKRNKVFAGVLFLLAVFAGVMAYQATQSEQRAVSSEIAAKNSLSDSKLQESEILVDLNEPQNAIALLTSSYNKNQDYPILLDRVFSITDTQNIANYEGTVIDSKAHTLLDPRGFIYEPILHTVALLHKEKGKSFVSVYDLHSEKQLFRTPILDIAESVNYTLDGRHIVVSGKEKQGKWDGAIVYEVRTGKEIRRIETTPSPALFGAISNDLKDLLVGTSRGEVFHLNDDGERDNILKVDGDIWEVRIHPKMRKVAIVESINKSSYKFHYSNLDNKKTKLLYSSPEEEVSYWNQCRFSQSGNYLILHGGGDLMGSLVIYDGNTGNQILKNESDHKGAVFEAMFSPDETLVATTSRDRSLRLWNLITLSKYGKVMSHNTEVWRGMFSPDQSKYVAFGSSADLAVWDIESGQLTHSFIKHEKPIIMAAFSKDGKYVYAGSSSGEIHKWKIDENSRQPILFTHDSRILNFVVDQKTGLVATSAEDGLLKLWNPDSLKLERVLTVEKDPILNGNAWFMALDREADFLGTFLNKSPWNSLSFKLWSWPELDLIKHYDLPPDTSLTAFSSNGNQFAYSNLETFRLSIFDIDSDEIIHTITDHGDQIFGINYSRDGKYLATACLDGYARVYSTENFNIVGGPFPFGFSYGAMVDFSIDSKYLLARSNLGRDANNAVIWDLATSKEKFRFKHNSGIFKHSFSFDGKRVYTCSKDNYVKMWALNDGELLGVFKHSEHVLEAKEFQGNSERIFTVDELGNARIWDTKSQKIIDGPFRGLPVESWLMKGELIPGSNDFATSYGNNSIAYWPSPVSLNKAIKPEGKMIEFFENYAGGQIDNNSSFNLKDRHSLFKTKSLSSFKVNGEELNRWINWKANNAEESITYKGDITRQKLTEFLLSQNTIEALQFALIISPMNKIIMAQLGKQLTKKADDLNLNESMRDFYQTRGQWYIKSSE